MRRDVLGNLFALDNVGGIVIARKPGIHQTFYITPVNLRG
jgi:hypothetical protein